jgi:hypothetical protein
MGTPGTRHADEVDLVILDLVRLVTLDSWTVERAADRLLTTRHNRAALRIALSRVSRARKERATPIADRAEATLTSAIAALDG